jgi:hypothetical protein
MWALLKNSGISKIATPTSSCIYSTKPNFIVGV